MTRRRTNAMDVPTGPPVWSGVTRLERVTDPEWTHAAGGTVTYKAFLGERWVGWIGDGREWDGWRFSGRRWWACWRQYGDTAARWDSGLTCRTRGDATAALAARACHGPSELVHLAADRAADRAPAQRPTERHADQHSGTARSAARQEVAR